MSYQELVCFWQGQNIATRADLEAVLNGQIVNFAYHSGKIENENITYNDTRDIFERDSLSNYTGDLRTIFEIRNAREAMDFVLAAFGERRAFDGAFLRQLQYELAKNTYDGRRYSLGERPGEYKRYDYVTGREEVGALPEDVEAEIDELMADLAENELARPEQVLTAAAYFHAKFENIHPFADGNGRTGRLAANYFLLLHNHPPLIIHEEDRKEYYAALEAWDTRQELAPSKEFFLLQLEKTWARQLQRRGRRN